MCRTVQYAPREVFSYETSPRLKSITVRVNRYIIATQNTFISRENLDYIGGDEKKNTVVLDCGERRAIERGDIYKVNKNEYGKAFQRPKRK